MVRWLVVVFSIALSYPSLAKNQREHAEPKQPPNTQIQADKDNQRAVETAPFPKQARSDFAQAETDGGKQNGEQEGTEFWPPFHGYRLKITDTLIAAFTALLFFATWALYLATRRLVEGADETARRQLRAYIYLESASILDGMTVDPPDPGNAGRPSVAMMFKNSGQTPASNFVSWAQISIVEPINERTLQAPELVPKFSRHVAANTASHKNLAYQRVLTKSEIEDLASGVKCIYLHGRIEYDDIFGKHHFSNFRLVWAGVYPPAPSAMLNFSEQGNDAD